MVRFLLIGTFQQKQVVTHWTPSTLRQLPEIEILIDRVWAEVGARPGVKLYDGPVCRLESFEASDEQLQLVVSRTSYRVLTGTNFYNPHLADIYGPAVMGNPIGVSTGVLTSDNFWLMGRRNQSVAYYPGRVHPFAGSIDVREHVDIFDDAEREIREEITLPADEPLCIELLGLVEDQTLRHPETAFRCKSQRTRDELIAAIDSSEHDGAWDVKNEPDAVSRALQHSSLTPVAQAVLLLGGRETFGQPWFDHHAKQLCAP